MPVNSFILTSAFWISESLRLDICGLEGIFILATAALDKELELAVVSLSCLGVKGSCEMVTFFFYQCVTSKCF